MVRVVYCHAGVLGSDPDRPKRFSPWNYFTGGSGNWCPSWPLGAVGAILHCMSAGTVEARLSRNKSLKGGRV